MINVVIVDDEFPSRQELSSLLLNINDVKIVAECSLGQEAIDYLHENSADLIFLDIEMPQINGLDIARIINTTIKNPPKIIFSTGYEHFAVKAFDLDAFDYITKPYSQERILITIMRYRNQAKKNSSKAPPEIFKLPVWQNDKMILINAESEINLIKSEQQKVIICAKDGEYEINTPLKELEQKLKDHGFIRTHKSFIVNINKVKEVTPWFNDTYILTLEDCAQKEIPVSRHYLQEFKKLINI